MLSINLYSQEFEVSIEVNGVKLYGTFAYQLKLDNKPILIIVAGSGAIDRDGNSPNSICNSYKLLSDSLIKSEFAVLRFDKRGIGKSINNKMKEEDIKFINYSEDLVEWINVTKKENQNNKIYLVGHSEGSLHAILAAQKLSVNGIISINGAGFSIDSILKKQLISQPDYIKDLAFPIIDSLKIGKKAEKVNSVLLSLFRPSAQQYLIDWMKYSPKEEINKLNCPKLIFQSALDMQIDTTNSMNLHNKELLSTLYISPYSNHIFKAVSNMSENIDSYNNPKYSLDNFLIRKIIEFVTEKK